MKVLCIDNTDVSLSISVGKWYKIEKSVLEKWESSGIKLQTYYITLDNGTRGRINKKFFITIEELRQKKLQELGI